MTTWCLFFLAIPPLERVIRPFTSTIHTTLEAATLGLRYHVDAGLSRRRAYSDHFRQWLHEPQRAAFFPILGGCCRNSCNAEAGTRHCCPARRPRNFPALSQSRTVRWVVLRRRRSS